MKWGRKQRTHHIGYLPIREVDTKRSGGTGRPVGPRAALRSAVLRIKNSGVVGWRGLVTLLALLGVLFLVFALLLPRVATGARDRQISVDPNSAGPDVVLAEVAGVDVSSPIHPADVTGLGYHPDGEDLLGMSPRGKERSSNFLLRLFEDGAAQEKIWYHLMDPAGRSGPRTGALDVGAEAGSAVYAPVTGKIVAIRPDPLLRKEANVVVLKPADNPDVRISVSLVRDIRRGVGPDLSVRAGVTELGSVADSRKFLKPQLSSYAPGDGNHITVSASKAN